MPLPTPRGSSATTPRTSPPHGTPSTPTPRASPPPAGAPSAGTTARDPQASAPAPATSPNARTQPALPPVRLDSDAVRLAWLPGVDLDLYVTTPDARTIYFANAATTHGTLARDVDCGDRSASTGEPASETIALRTLASGTYRVGVDFVDVCMESPGPVSFRIAVDRAGARQEAEGTLSPGEFRSAALVFEVPGTHSDAHGGPTE